MLKLLLLATFAAVNALNKVDDFIKPPNPVVHAATPQDFNIGTLMGALTRSLTKSDTVDGSLPRNKVEALATEAKEAAKEVLPVVPALNFDALSGRWFEGIKTRGADDSYCTVYYLGQNNPDPRGNNKFGGLKIFQDAEQHPMLNMINFRSNRYQPGMITGYSAITGDTDLTWIYKEGPIVNGQYQYLVVSNFLRYPVTVLVRDPDLFNEKYRQEVLKWLSDNEFPKLIYTNEYRGCVYQDEVFQYVAEQAAVWRMMGHF